MTTTSTYQGLGENARSSSRVLNPPGGGSSNIFGFGSEDSAPAQRKPTPKKTEPDSQPSPKPTNNEPAARKQQKIGEDSFHTLFGLGDNEDDGVKTPSLKMSSHSNLSTGKRSRHSHHSDYNESHTNVFGCLEAESPVPVNRGRVCKDDSFSNVFGLEAGHDIVQSLESVKLDSDSQRAYNTPVLRDRKSGARPTGTRRVLQESASVNPITGEPLYPQAQAKPQQSAQGDQEKTSEDPESADGTTAGSTSPPTGADQSQVAAAGRPSQDHTSTRVSQPPGGRSTMTSLW